MTEDERLDGITDSMDMNLDKLGVSEGQGRLVCCSPQGRKELDVTKQQHLPSGSGKSLSTPLSGSQN